MMRRLIQFCLTIVLATPLLHIHHPVSAEPHTETLYTCIFPAGPFAGQEIIVRYDAPDAELSLVSNNTGETVQVLENGLHTPQFEVRDWSSDCRYMIASLGIWGEQQTAAWDVVENRRVGTIETQGQRYTDLIWSPANDYRLIVESLSGAWLWHLPTNMQSHLSTYGDPATGQNFEYCTYNTTSQWWNCQRFAWDLERNQFLAVPIDPNRDGVAVYDFYTGQEVSFYPLNPTNRTVYFRLFDQNRAILVFDYKAPVGEASQLVMYNRNDGTSLSLSPVILASLHPTATFSTSRRYLIIKTWHLFIWDLENLDSLSPHRPLQQYEIAHGSSLSQYIDGFRMSPNETRLQAVAHWHGMDFTIYQWDMATGERFYAKKYLETVCDDLSQLAPEDDVELVTWACSYR